MPTFNRLTFTVGATTTGGPSGPLVVTPFVDGASLIELVGAYEQDRGYSPAGGYGGLVPSYFRYGDLPTYFLGKAEKQWPKPDHSWLLACDCGEVGCWPLTTRVIALVDAVTWTDFAQDHRPAWDYSGFGPFVFARERYDRAVRWVIEELGSEAD